MKSDEILKPKIEKEILNAIGTLPPNKMLYSYAKLGSLEGVKKALEKGANINHHDDFERHTALAIASLERFQLAILNFYFNLKITS